MSEIIKNPASVLYLYWKKRMEKEIGKGNVSMDMSAKIAKAPYARIFMMGNPTRSTDLEGNEASTLLSFQTECFADGQNAISDVYDYDEISHQIMLDFGFRRTYGAELITNADTSIKRCVSRYSRIYTGVFENLAQSGK